MVAFHIRETVIAPRAPWQNPYAERLIGSSRRECLDHVVVNGEQHLRPILSKHVDYYDATRTPHERISHDQGDQLPVATQRGRKIFKASPTVALNQKAQQQPLSREMLTQ
jgi:hypothetical protein